MTTDDPRLRSSNTWRIDPADPIGSSGLDCGCPSHHEHGPLGPAGCAICNPPKLSFGEHRRRLIDYLQSKVALSDWHGVSDAANDLRELEAAERGRREVAREQS